MVLGYVSIASLVGFCAALCSVIAGLGIWLSIAVFYGAAFVTIGVLVARIVMREDEGEDMIPLPVSANG
ncbi:hypothetical protein [Actibacterium sp. 188UL27-1]|uniref:hypothetical protein n=1 Tax=Actibacterium sp. 188UL27-1 TaxID=2786961 RepID=UPI00195DA32A|nr:hypothetical protein [Actibacterium sp. 188UL27-1]MBM7069350.1 hypothetical protein [Actibacterium sp. 188UL27-1]